MPISFFESVWGFLFLSQNSWWLSISLFVEFFSNVCYCFSTASFTLSSCLVVFLQLSKSTGDAFSTVVLFEPLNLHLQHFYFLVSISPLNLSSNLLPFIPYWWFSHWFFSPFFFDVADFQLTVLNWIIFFLNLFIYGICGLGMCTPRHMYGGQKTTLRSQFSSSIICVLGLNSGRQSWQVPLPTEPSFWP